MSFIDNLRDAFMRNNTASKSFAPTNIDQPTNQPRKVAPEHRFGIAPDFSIQRRDVYEDTINRRGDFESMLDQFSSTGDHLDRLNLLRDARDKFGDNAVFNRYIDRLGREEEAYYDQEAYINDVPNIGGYVKDALNQKLASSMWSPRRV